MAGDDDWPAVAGNLRKARKSWTWMTRVLGREEAYPRVSRLFFKVVVQAALLFGSETWVLIPVWSGPWADSSTGPRDGLQGGSRGGGGEER